MARFYFHVRIGDRIDLDQDGTEAESVMHAHREAVSAARDMLRDKLLQGELPLSAQFEIADAAGRRVDTVKFSEAVTFR